MKYDDASYHSEGDFPEDSPAEFGGTHIALFLRWCFVKGWASDRHLRESPEAVQAVIDGTLPATDFLFHYCDGKLVSDSLNEEGNRFAAAYYEVEYMNRYAGLFMDEMYTEPESAHDFDALAEELDELPMPDAPAGAVVEQAQDPELELTEEQREEFREFVEEIPLLLEELGMLLARSARYTDRVVAYDDDALDAVEAFVQEVYFGTEIIHPVTTEQLDRMHVAYIGEAVLARIGGTWALCEHPADFALLCVRLPEGTDFMVTRIQQRIRTGDAESVSDRIAFFEDR